MSKLQDTFTNFTSQTATLMGRPWIFVTSLVLLVLWGMSGPLLGFSDTWQLVINTSTTIITFLMVFIIQNTQNRDSIAINIKLDALLDKHSINENDLIEAEDKSDERLEKKKQRVRKRAEKTGSKQKTKK